MVEWVAAAAERFRARARDGVAKLLAPALLVAALAAASGGSAAADTVKADISLTTAGGYARIVFRFSQGIEADARLSGGVLVVSFRQPVELSVDSLVGEGADYVSAARRDPDGRGVRIALTRKVQLNAITAGERLFVDLLPEDWQGPVPSLPVEVIEDLSRRAREAERAARDQRASRERRPAAPIRVRVAHQPSFSRYVFELPDPISVSANRSPGQLGLTFDAPLTFDLADAKASRSPLVEAIESSPATNAATVTFTFVGRSDVRTFRDDNNFVVDVVAPSADGARADGTAKPAGEGASGEDALISRFSRVILANRGNPPDEQQPKSAPARPADGAAGPPPAKAAAADKPAQPQAPTVAPAAAPPADKVASPAPANPPAASAAALPAAAEKPAAPAAAQATPAAPDTVAVAVRGGGEGDALRLTFPFAAPTPAAAFLRADTFWLVFDTASAIDLGALKGDARIADAGVSRQADAAVVRLRFDRMRALNLAADGTAWTVSAADVVDPPAPIGASRYGANEGNASAQIMLDDARKLHRLDDPDVGDTLLVVSALGPARGLLKSQDFVEFRALASAHGAVIQPLADDLRVDLAPDRILVGRAGGLSLSAAGAGGKRAQAFDPDLWAQDRAAAFNGRVSDLIAAAGAAADGQRGSARLELARFYFARELYAEAKAVLDLLLAEERPTPDNSYPLTMHAVANIMLDRNDEALKDLANPTVAAQADTSLWRGLALARQGKWTEARDGFRKADIAIGALPAELQRPVLVEAVRTAIEMRDFKGAAEQLNTLAILGIPGELAGAVAVLSGRLQQGLGHNPEALTAYRAAVDSTDRAAAAQGRLREIALRYELGDMQRAEVIGDLETLTAIWRGDETEAEGLQVLARLYTEEERYRDAFNVLRTALKTFPNSDVTRRIQDSAAATFDALFLGGKAEALPAIDALSLFYDFRDLTPIGRRGDEMIRRLADRLVALDLLDQAAELLQHQVDHRLQGAARAQVATKLAAIYLLNRKPERALAVLRATRSGELSNEIRNHRLLLEARALCDGGRPQLALEVIENVQGPEAVRLRADVLWAAQRYRESAEQIELLFGDRWRNWQPLNDIERHDVLRAGLGFALGDDPIGLARFREKFGPGMSNGADRRAFEVVTDPRTASTQEFRDVARTIAAFDTTDQFLRDLRARFPESSGLMPKPSSAAAPLSQSALPGRVHAADLGPAAGRQGP